MKRLVMARRVSQVSFLLLFIHILWSTTYPLKGKIPPTLLFDIDPLIAVITSISERIILPGLCLSCIMLAAAFVAGRFFCGWVCPMGTMIDMGGVFKNGKRPEDDSLNRKIRKIKYGVLGIIALTAIFGAQTAWLFDPIGIAARFVSLNLIPTAAFFLNSLFIFLIKGLSLYNTPVQDLYRAMKGAVLGIKICYFSHSLAIFLFFILIVSLSSILKRLWCRALCPLGALYALAARFSPLRRVIEKCAGCGICKSLCRMGAIKDDLDYVKSECVLCMDCVYDCPQHVTVFRWGFRKKGGVGGVGRGDKPAMTRGEFLFLAASSIFLFGFKRREEAGSQKAVIRPPAALKEEDFRDRCVRCGNCMKVCITNGLQPVLFQTGLRGLWTPQLVPETGYCEYQCTLCGNACPTGAIPRVTVEEKRLVKLGVAEIDHSICIPWATGKDCIVCQEHCPVAKKAIRLEKDPYDPKAALKPCVDEGLCVGCGICQNKCPVRPVRAIKVSPRNSYRT